MAPDRDGHTPLHWAARRGNFTIVEYMAGELKADVNEYHG